MQTTFLCMWENFLNYNQPTLVHNYCCDCFNDLCDFGNVDFVVNGA